VSRQTLGAAGERLARGYLERQGYTILAANYRCRWGEIDLVASEGETMVFVEVRTLRDGAFGTPEESLGPRKALHLRRAAQTYLRQHGDPAGEWRIDFVAVVLSAGGVLRDLRLLRGAVEE